MAKFTIKPSGKLDLIEQGLAKMFKEDDRGNREEVGDYKNSLLPYGGRRHRVFYDEEKRQYRIGLSNKELSELAEKIKLVDPKSKQLIKVADKHNEHCEFFKHEELCIIVANEGITLDDEDAWGKFWKAAVEYESKMFDIDGQTDNPLVKAVQDYRVTTSGYSEKEIDRDITESMRATEIYHSIKDDFEQMKETAKAMEIVIGKNPDIALLRQAIFAKITTEKDFKTRDGERFIERFLRINDMPTDEKNLLAAITDAIGFKIIEKKGRRYFFEEEVLGTTHNKVYETLQEEGNKRLKAQILALVKEKQGLIETI